MKKEEFSEDENDFPEEIYSFIDDPDIFEDDWFLLQEEIFDDINLTSYPHSISDNPQKTNQR